MKKILVLMCALALVAVLQAQQVMADPPVENGYVDIVPITGDLDVGVEVVGDVDNGIEAIDGELDGADDIDRSDLARTDGEEFDPDMGCLGMGPMGDMIGMFVVMGLVFYFLILRPQKKRDKAQKELMANIKVTDEVATIGGIHGKVVRVKDDTFVIESGVGTQKSFIQVDRGAVARIVKEGSGKNAPTPTFDDSDDVDAED